MNLWMIGVLIATAIPLLAGQPAFAHSGGLNRQGCHAGSQPYHCHRAQPATNPISRTKRQPAAKSTPQAKPRPVGPAHDRAECSPNPQSVAVLPGASAELIALASAAGFRVFATTAEFRDYLKQLNATKAAE